MPILRDRDSLGIPICGTTPWSRTLFSFAEPHTGAVGPYVRPLCAALGPLVLMTFAMRPVHTNLHTAAAPARWFRTFKLRIWGSEVRILPRAPTTAFPGEFESKGIHSDS